MPHFLFFGPPGSGKTSTALAIANQLYGMGSVVRRVNSRAKYGDESVYFDLDDLENTVGSWEMYGSDSKDRYPAIQEEFFNRACQVLARRDAMLAFCVISGVAGLLTWGVK